MPRVFRQIVADLGPLQGCLFAVRQWLAFGGHATLWRVVALLVLAIAPVSARGQIMAVDVDEATPNNRNKHPFVLPGQSNEITEALEDFERYRKRGTWEKAFKSLDKVLESAPKGLVPMPDGVLAPSRVLVRQSMANLPAAGKSAYRVFHDAEAKALLEQAKGPDEFERLSKAAGVYLFTSVGDVAADRLGDMLYEQGNFPGAIDAWRSILDYRPDSTLSRPLLLTKLGLALLRSGRSSELTSVIRQLTERHADELVELGGKKVDPGKHLLALADGKTAAVAVAMQDEPDDLQLADDLEPLWQFRMQGKTDPQNPTRGLFAMNNNWGRLSFTDMTFPAAVDGKRLYVNVLGYFLALDLETGKLLWRSGRFHELSEKLQQSPWVSAERYTITNRAGEIWATSRPVESVGQSHIPFNVIKLNPESGAEIYNSKSAGDLKEWSVLGSPLLANDGLFVTAVKQQQSTDLHLLSIDNAHKIRWSTQLGNYQQDQNQIYNQRASQPGLVASGDKILVDTQAGAVISVDAHSGAVDWGLYYDSSLPDNNYGYNRQANLVTDSRPQLIDGLLYIKGMYSPRLLAIDPAAPSVRWRRPVLESSLLLGLDRERLYMAGDEFTAYDLRDRKLLWANRLPVGTGWMQPLITKNRLYHFSPRGIYEIDKVDGRVLKLVRGADLESLGGKIVLTPQAIITVSNLAITAYPRKSQGSGNGGQGSGEGK